MCFDLKCIQMSHIPLTHNSIITHMCVHVFVCAQMVIIEGNFEQSGRQANRQNEFTD